MKESPTRLRICHLLSSLEVGGAERIALRLARAQAELNHDVTILAMRGGPLEQEVKASGLRVRVCHPPTWRVALGCTTEFLRSRYDIVNSHNRWAQKMAAFAQPSTVVMTLHAECRADYGRALRRPWLNGVIAVSERALETFRKVHPSLLSSYPLTVIENGVAVEPQTGAREATRRSLGLGDEYVFIVVARLDPFKNLTLLLQAFARCVSQSRELRLLVVGAGACHAELVSLSNELGLADVVQFLGQRSDVQALLAAADCFVLSSISEGMPIAVLEAMAAGLPVVSTAVGGVPEVVHDGVTGSLVASGDADALAQAMLELSKNGDRSREMGAAGQSRVMDRFSLAAMAQRYVEFYQLLRHSRSGRSRDLAPQSSSSAR